MYILHHYGIIIIGRGEWLNSRSWSRMIVRALTCFQVLLLNLLVIDVVVAIWESLKVRILLLWVLINNLLIFGIFERWWQYLWRIHWVYFFISTTIETILESYLLLRLGALLLRFLARWNIIAYASSYFIQVYI